MIKWYGLDPVPLEYKRSYNRWQDLTERCFGKSRRPGDKPQLILSTDFRHAIRFCRWFHTNEYSSKKDDKGRYYNMILGEIIGMDSVASAETIFFVPIEVRMFIQSKNKTREKRAMLMKKYGLSLHPKILAYMMTA